MCVCVCVCVYLHYYDCGMLSVKAAGSIIVCLCGGEGVYMHVRGSYVRTCVCVCVCVCV